MSQTACTPSDGQGKSFCTLMSQEEDAGADGEGSSFRHHRNLSTQLPREEWLSCQKSDAPNASTTAALSKARSPLEMACWKPYAAFPFGDGAMKSLCCQEASGLLSLWLFGRWPCLGHMGNLASQVRLLSSVAAAGFPVSDFRVAPLSHLALILLHRGRARVGPQESDPGSFNSQVHALSC